MKNDKREVYRNGGFKAKVSTRSAVVLATKYE